MQIRTLICDFKSSLGQMNGASVDNFFQAFLNVDSFSWKDKMKVKQIFVEWFNLIAAIWTYCVRWCIVDKTIEIFWGNAMGDYGRSLQADQEDEHGGDVPQDEEGHFNTVLCAEKNKID